MQLDSQERSPIFYIILIGLLIFAIVFFSNSVKKAINSGKEKAKSAKASIELVMFNC